MENGLKKITIKNYQSIKNASLDLGQITVITGKSDSGKSAFFRAVKGVATNQSGQEFITKGEKECRVSIDDVSWIKTLAKENSYEIGDRTWAKCGGGVPDDVCETLKLGIYEFGKDIKSMLNFYGQLDKAFIVQGNPSDNAKIIGSISNIHIIYNALREAEKDTKNIKKRMTILQDHMEEYSDKLKVDLKQQDRLDNLYVKLDLMYKKVNVLVDSIEGLEFIQKKAVEVDRYIRDTKKQYLRYKKMDFKKATKLVADITAIQGLKAQYDETTDKMRAIATSYSECKSIDADKCLGILKNIENLTELKSRLLRADNNLFGVDDDLGDIANKIAELKKAEQELLKLEERCEQCGAQRRYWDKNK